MSVRITSKVWDNAANVKSERLLVLLALADWANDEGKCWPNMKTIAHKARTSKDGAAKIIAWLEKEGYISVQRGIGRGNQSHYTVHPSPIKGDAEQPFYDDKKGDAETPFKEIKGDAEKATQERIKGDPETEKAILKRLKGDPEFQGTIRNARVNRYEPSVQPSAQPPGECENDLPQSEIINVESTLAKAIRELCGKRTLILSPKDKTDLEFVLQGLHHENATIEQVEEFKNKIPFHWIGINPKTKKPKPPRIMQVLEFWYEVREMDISDTSAQQNYSESDLAAITAKYTQGANS